MSILVVVLCAFILNMCFSMLSRFLDICPTSFYTPESRHMPNYLVSSDSNTEDDEYESDDDTDSYMSSNSDFSETGLNENISPDDNIYGSELSGTEDAQYFESDLSETELCENRTISDPIDQDDTSSIVSE